MRERGEVRGSGWRNRIFLSEPFPSFMSLVARLEQRGGRGREDIWRVLMFVSIFEIRRFIRVRWIVVRSVINIVGVGV